MRRDELTGLYNAFHRENPASIMEHGILSHRLAETVLHRSIADAEVQRNRAGVVVPPSRHPLHTYANLYVNCRNIVMYRFKMDLVDAGGSDEELCVVKVSPDVLDLPGVIVTDRNAAALPRWMTPDVGVAALDRDDVFSRYWNDRDHAQRMCAEVLVPDRVDPDYITAVYVSCATPRAATQAICGEVPVEVAGRLFFRS